MDKISIIVPAYNIEKYIEATVDSIRAQTYRNLEIILVNDGSTDNTPQILERLASLDERIKVIHQENSGVTSARLCGINEATGQWIGFVDGDDTVDPTMYETLWKNAKTYGADISHCGYRMVFPNRVDLYYGTGRIVEQDHAQGLEDLLEGAFVEPSLLNKLFRRDLLFPLIQNNHMDRSIKTYEDLLMNYYLFREANKAVFQDVCLYNYTIRKNSAATSELNENKLCDPLRVMRILGEETAVEPALQDIINCRIARILFLQATMGSREPAELVRGCRERARRELREMLPSILRGKNSIRQKVFTLWACISPASCGWCHRMYSKIRGTDKKYKVS